jgi:hypothetical protein
MMGQARNVDDEQARNVDANSEGFEMTADGRFCSQTEDWTYKKLTRISRLNAITFSKLQRALP